MILTDRFVYIHQPKTGGTFVVYVVCRLHGIGWDSTRQMPVVPRQVAHSTPLGTVMFTMKKHETCREIPQSHQGKPILAAVRNPYDLYVSQYEFGWWKRSEYLECFQEVPGFDEEYPHFPEITFAEFVELVGSAFVPPDLRGQNSGKRMGWAAWEFVRYYFRDPVLAAQRLDDDFVRSRQYLDDLHDVTFVRTEHLNTELHAFLLSIGYNRSELEFISGLGKVLPLGKGRRDEQKWEKYYTPELKQLVRDKDSLLFTMFPEYDA